jgi:DNA-binding NarL/FixJ family response regulator
MFSGVLAPVNTPETERTRSEWRSGRARGNLFGVEGQVSFLIAEDDDLVGKIIARALDQHGNTKLVKTIEDAAAALEKTSYTAVIVDVGLPDGCGLDVITAARLYDPSVCALVVSGGVDERRLAEAHHLGAHYLLKPIDARQLGLFAIRMRAKLRQTRDKIAARVEQWTVEYDLTPAETAVLELAAHGTPRSQIAELRGVVPTTLKKQVQIILAKTGDSSLDAAVSRLLRAIVDAG